MKSYSLYELNEFIRRIMALNFSNAIWIKAEFAQVNNSRGHYFIDLVQKSENEEEIIAQATAVLWSRDHRRLKRQIGKTLTSLLQEGIQVMIKAKVDFHERYGLKLIIEDIDPAYTLGKLEMKRRAIIETLRKKALLEKNARLNLPLVIQRVAVLSSERAAGYQDYLKHLENNSYGYSFHNNLFPTAVQGVNVIKEITAQLTRIKKLKIHFDCVVIIRGGGARLDLMAFDNLELAEMIAKFPLPVLTGIGHEIDETITDMVAHSALKTPTAVAAFFVEHNLEFESSILNMGQQIHFDTKENIKDQNYQLREIEQTIHLQTKNNFQNAQRFLDKVKEEIPKFTKTILRSQNKQLAHVEELIHLLNPKTILKRGFSITELDGKLVKSTKNIKTGNNLTTHLADGTIKSTVDKIETNDKEN